MIGVDGELPATATVAADLPAAFALLATTLPRGWARRFGAATAVVTMAPAPTLNGVWVMDENTRPADVDAALEAVAATGAPHCVALRPGALPLVGPIAERRGMEPLPSIPLMAAARVPEGAARRGASAAGLTIRRLAPDELDTHLRIAAPAFGAPIDVFAALVTPKLVKQRSARLYVGELDGQPVATAMSLRLGDGLGIFNVATPESRRRRGYAAALTARACADGRAAGAEWAWLQSSESGYGCYQRLGFLTLEWWECWITAG
ncbi:MAG: GNAT family N-acetyltransferase [Solirubrobacteraceae bacterium]